MPQMFKGRAQFLPIYKGFHFGLEQLLTHCAMGLLTGFSIISAVEIIYFAVKDLRS